MAELYVVESVSVAAEKIWAVLADFSGFLNWAGAGEIRIEGEGVGIEVLARNGRIVMDLQHRRLRETMDGGSTYRETMPRNRDLVDAAIIECARACRTVSSLDAFPCQVGCDVPQDSQDDRANPH